MQVICLEEDAFLKLVDRLIEHVDHRLDERQQKWIDGSEVMKMLNVKALSTLQGLRDEGKIRFSQPSKKIILYDRDSINEYLEKHAKNTF
ncbi:helix-turn-helix domain-containing protein [uncultured Roseivirga sp.]|uniref:helix-turn-helix domain-containing protein n=1 Tax=uncultured Roseivirga sp. TaxID=543088 RepID=UPI0030DB21A0|tara:strand:- start:10437 stop:10706 length:270 start_codon:yes stop_codon:yes gene_type:complete